ncbi:MULTISPECIES: hypothetical protein [Curtobacterium]|jgi:hypothetical protein|uniref:Uncharacterized protein n=2 Tax=Curtobacterium TaxID=2034 RepID=A0A5P8YUB1_9MICO|nr:hypothetical protein [Curtobacterium flaccumfaciens]MBO9041468.1 hypothetical protein [Curtobacterium flaccumfaciens pv. flaccumfaciens]MBO9044954.1 hypothetical protein [Curtobacterium flaccumfaciens pv. flaccumfaciens]MBO9048903.1 hypothetical protein [Curtobacterium flaccumfaciens pv. flaccumfaciens]MBO9057754.1 hypothetical protein [Curtobacterium flaccumfaciens pv. flaccumfaciens]MBT1543193.1 hypothetical protein [Curtobacterium flaccumfaciens pv. flaccumfaciens]
MAVHAFASLAGSPGVTTAAFAFAVHWPRPVVVFEAETANATSAMTGFFRSNLHPSAGGLDKVAVAYSRNVLTWQDLITPERGLSIAVHDLPALPQPIPTLPNGHRMWVVPGFHKLSIVDGVRRMWARFPNLFRAISEANIDVIVDLGRIAHEDIRLPLLDGADRVTIFSESTMVDLNRIYRRAELPDFAERLQGVGRAEKYRLVLTESRYEAIPAGDFGRNVLPVLAELPWDPDGAAVFSLGRPDAKPQRNAYRQAVRRAVAELDAQTTADLDRKVVG